MAKTKLQGLRQMKGRLQKAERVVAQAAAAALFINGEAIMGRSKAEFVPVDNSDLKSSGHVRPPFRGPGTLITVELVYGGTAVVHAIVTHEHPSAFSPPSWSGTVVQFTTGGPKYLEIPLMQAVPTLARDIARDIHFDRLGI